MYTKPTLVELGAAAAAIQNQNKGQCHSDGRDPATINAYEADE